MAIPDSRRANGFVASAADRAPGQALANELHLRVSSPRAAPRMYLYGDRRNPVLEAAVDGAPIDADKAFAGLKARPESLRVPHAALGTLLFQRADSKASMCVCACATPAAGYRMEVVDQSYGIGWLPGATARPDSMIPFPMMTDSVCVRKSYTY